MTVIDGQGRVWYTGVRSPTGHDSTALAPMQQKGGEGGREGGRERGREGYIRVRMGVCDRERDACCVFCKCV